MRENKTVIMPAELTAENGAKSAMMGEFSINFPIDCSCDGDEDCSICDGSGEYLRKINIPWTSIKEIYKFAVENFGTENNENQTIR